MVTALSWTSYIRVNEGDNDLIHNIMIRDDRGIEMSFGDNDGGNIVDIYLDLANNEKVTAIEYHEFSTGSWGGYTCKFSIFTSSDIEANKRYGPFAELCEDRETDRFYLEVPSYYNNNFGQYLDDIFRGNMDGWFGISNDLVMSL